MLWCHFVLLRGSLFFVSVTSPYDSMKGVQSKLFHRLITHICVLLAVLVFFCGIPSGVRAQSNRSATITIDARKVENRISPLLYGQFLEFMYEGIKGGLHAELIRNRSFEERPNVIGLSRNWARYPDDRNDDYALTFHWDNQFAYPSQRKEHSLRIEAGDG